MSSQTQPGQRVRATVELLRSGLADRAFHVDEAAFLGVSRDRVERACAAGLLVRVGRGWYVLGAEADGPGLDIALRGRLEALRGQSRDVVLCGTSAAAVWGLPLPPGLRDVRGLEVLADHPREAWGGQRRYETVRRWQVPGAFVVDGPHGERITDPIQTAIDLGRGLPMPFALVALDAAMALTQRLGIPPEVVRLLLDDRAAAARASRDVRGVLQAVPHADPRAESALESIVRGRIIDAGLPTPELQVPVTGVSGRQYRADLGLWIPGDPPGTTRLLIEADGLAKYAEVGDLAMEKRRQHDLEGHGYRFVRALYREAVHAPDDFIATIATIVAGG